MVRAQILSEQVYRHLLRLNLFQELAPGTPLGKAEFAARLGVSRTPVREAPGRLSEDFARLDALAQAARSPGAPRYLAAFVAAPDGHTLGSISFPG